MHTSRYVITFLTLLSSSLFAIADEPTVKDSLTTEETGKVDEIFSKLNDLSRPGCSVSVVRNGNILYSRGFGLAQMEYDIPINADTIFHIASISKQFTVFAVALLAADGKLDLDDDVRDYIP
jgi:CubicO group peptidase (beta-lactamase class C family)